MRRRLPLPAAVPFAVVLLTAGCGSPTPASTSAPSAAATSVVTMTPPTPGQTAVTATDTVTVTAAGTSDPTSPASGAPESSAAPTAPIAQSVASAGFASPSGKIVCSLTPSVVQCDVLGATFAAPPRPADCVDGQWGLSFELSPDGPGHMVCSGDPAYVGGDASAPPWWMAGRDSTLRIGQAQGYALGYGHTLTSGPLTCSIDPTRGVSCRSADNAHGFTASSATYRVW